MSSKDFVVLCRNCLFYREGLCHRMYIQTPMHGVYLAKADELRTNEKTCGKDAKWYIGKQDRIILPMDSKKPCYDK